MNKAIIHEINLDREGAIVGRHTLQGCIRLLDPGRDPASPLYSVVAPLWISLSKELLEATEVYYQEKATSWMAESTVGLCCRLMESSIADEMALCEEILPTEVARKVMEVVEHVFVTRIAAEMRLRSTEEGHAASGLSVGEVDAVNKLLRRVDGSAAEFNS